MSKISTIILILSLISLTTAYVFNGYEIRDLEKQDSFFSLEANLWTASSLKSSSIFTTCDSTYLLGGYGVLGPSTGTNYKGQYFQRTYQGLPSHNAISFSITFWLIDAWNPLFGDSFQIQFDSKIFNGWSLQIAATSKLCGSTLFGDLKGLKVFGTVLHSNSSLTLKVISQLSGSSSQKSFGFRDINLSFLNSTSTLSEQICGRGPAILSTNQCPCSEGNYQTSSLLQPCASCDPQCSNCYGPSASQCYGCAAGSSFNGTKCVTCTDSCRVCSGPAKNQCSACKPGYFLVNISTCVLVCDPPLIQTSYGDSYFCESPCSSNQYVYQDGTCKLNCIAPLSQTVIAGFKACVSACNTGEYLYQDGSCNSTCNSPLKKRITGGVKYCDSPCGLDENVYWNGTCSTQCSFPLVPSTQNGTVYCTYPCSANQYLLPNGTCLDSCSFPFKIRAEPGANYCDYTCSPLEFLSEDKTCTSECNLPFVTKIQGLEKVCISPCLISQYLNFNGTCTNSCVSPYIPKMIQGSQLCEFPCLSTQFLLPNGSCESSCTYPLLISTLTSDQKLCKQPCENTSDYYYEDGTCKPTCEPPNTIQNSGSFKTCNSSNSNTSSTSDPSNASDVSNSSSATTPMPTSTRMENIDIEENSRAIAKANDAGGTIMTVGVTMLSIIGSNNPGTFGLTGLVKMLPYIRYLKINYPLNLELMLDNLNSSLISFAFGPSMSSELESSFTKYPLPGKFDLYGIHSSFMVNYWQTMTSLLIIIGIIGIFSLISYFIKERGSLSFIVQKLKLVVKWNFFWMMFCTNFDTVILGTSLELRTLHVDSVLSALSFIVCLFVNFGVIFAFGFIIYIIRDMRKNVYQLSPGTRMDPKNKWEQHQLFYIGSKEDSLVKQIFMFPFLLRIYLFNFVVAYFFESPLAQSILITLLSLLLLIYMLWKKPFKSHLVFCQHVTDELIILIINICVFVLAMLDSYNSEAANVRDNIGQTIIVLNVIFNVTANIYLVAYLIQGFRAAYSNMRKHHRRGIVSWITALLAPFEIGGMDMDVAPLDTELPSPRLDSERGALAKQTEADNCLTEENAKSKRFKGELIKRPTSGLLTYANERDPNYEGAIKRNLYRETLQTVDGMTHNEKLAFARLGRFSPGEKASTTPELLKNIGDTSSIKDKSLSRDSSEEDEVSAARLEIGN